MKKGEVTVFLSLVFILIVSFILGIVQITILHTSKNLSRLVTDRALFSVFGEYQKELSDDYHVFAVDAGYGTGRFSEKNIVDRMYYYGDGVTEHEIRAIQLLTDQKGQPFREQVIACMEERYGLDMVKDLTGLTEVWEQQEIQAEEIGKKEETMLDELDAIKENAQEAESESTSEEIQDNPFSCIEQIDRSGILSIVMPEDKEVSQKAITPHLQVSNRSIQKGRGSFPFRQHTDGIGEKMLFNEYVIDAFTNAVRSGENDRSLSYETEYILSGKPSDRENLESVVLKIFFIRMALNYVYLQGDKEKQMEAEIMALALSAVLLVPEVAQGLKQLILLAWAAGESVVDIRTLLAGEKAALLKTKETWRLSLSELVTLGGGSERIQGNSAENGISYEDYLRGFLFMGKTDEITMRCLDRVEDNLRTEHGMEVFRADWCVTRLQTENTIPFFGNLVYRYPAVFGYE